MTIWNRGTAIGGPYTGLTIVDANLITTVAIDMDDWQRRPIPGLQAESKRYPNVRWGTYEFVGGSWIWHERHLNL